MNELQIQNTIVDDRKTLIYCRESRDDYGDNYQAIETQREILVQFCQRKGLVNVVRIMMDDDVSGTCFKRLQKVITMVRNKEVEVIVFKDASRLGRNLRDSLNFIHELEVEGAEIIFESENYDEDFFPSIAWFNERRAKDDSLKIRRVMRHKMENGNLVTKTLYGYQKIDNNQLIIDPDTGTIVKRVFDLFLKGYGTHEIASILNKEQVPTPTQSCAKSAPVWNRQHIWRMLANDTYTGSMTYGKKTTISYKNKKCIYRPEKDWIVIQDHHEAIIDKETFEKAQALRVRTSKTKSCKKGHPFSGLLICGRCGSHLILRQRANQNDAYICNKNHREGGIKDHIRVNYGCSPHHITESYLYDIVIKYIRCLLNENISHVFNAIKENHSMNETKKLLDNIGSKINQLNNTIDKIYNDKINGIISEQFFIRQYERYRDLLEQESENLKIIENKLNSDKTVIGNLKITDILEAVSTKTVSAAQLMKVFEKIVFFEKGDITVEDKQKYNLSDNNFHDISENGGLLFIENFSVCIGFEVQS